MHWKRNGARSSSLEKQFSEQLEELRMEGTEAALRGPGQRLDNSTS